MILLFLAAVGVFVLGFIGCALLSYFMGLSHDNDPLLTWACACFLFGILCVFLFIALKGNYFI